MKRMTFVLALVTFVFACNKTPVNPPTPGEPQVPDKPKMIYKNLLDTAVLFDHSASFDLDGNGEKDIRFGTLLSADPLSHQDKMQWLVVCSFYTSLPVNTNENIPVLNLNDSIPVNDFSGYSWYNAPGIVLSQKVISVSTPPYWEGVWTDASHRFVPVQLKKNNLSYNGWVEISFDKLQEKIILHKSAVSEQPGKTVFAGNRNCSGIIFLWDKKTSQMKKLCLSVLPIILCLIAFAQDKGVKIEIKKETQWYASPYAWIVGGAIFILILVALLRGKRSN
jgi:hypothetical protein